MHPAKEHFDDWAGIYDDYYADQEIGDRAFYVELAREADGPVLEVGCGTGRIYLELLRADVDAYGIDVSGEMLDVLRERAEDVDRSPHVRQADVTDFQPEREYALVIVPFRAFLHVIRLEDQQAALRTLREALAPGGRLVLNFFTPDIDWIAERYGEPQTEMLERDGQTYQITTLSELEDDVEWIVRERRTVEHDGEVVSESTFRLTLVTKREFELLCETTGWSDWNVYGGFDREPLERAGQEQVWIVEK